MIKNFTPPLIFGLFLGFAWQHFEWLFWLNFIGFTYPYLWIKSPNTTSVKVAQMLLFLLPWFTIGGFWLNSYNTNLYLFGVGVYSLLYALPFLMTIAVTKKLQQKFHVLSFLIFFLAVEYIQEAFHPFVPWFNLGNGFAASSFQIPILQILGSRGVSLMVLVIAFMLGKSYLNNKAKQPKRQFHWLLILPFILPYLKSHEVIESAKAAGVDYCLTIGIDGRTSREAIALSERFSGVYAAIGTHPHDAEKASDEDFLHERS